MVLPSRTRARLQRPPPHAHVHLGATWVPLGCHLGATWVPLGCHLGASWMPVGCHLGATWMPLGCHLGATWMLPNHLWTGKENLAWKSLPPGRRQGDHRAPHPLLPRLPRRAAGHANHHRRRGGSRREAPPADAGTASTVSTVRARWPHRKHDYYTPTLEEQYCHFKTLSTAAPPLMDSVRSPHTNQTAAMLHISTNSSSPSPATKRRGWLI